MIPKALFGPVGAKAHQKKGVEDVNAAFDGFYYGRFRLYKGVLQFGCPDKQILGGKEVAEGGHERAH